MVRRDKHLTSVVGGADGINGDDGADGINGDDGTDNNGGGVGKAAGNGGEIGGFGRVAGIIAEYNPFHNGHLWHLEKTKEITGADACIAVMSGDFVQRGEPAILDKWKRAEAAVRSGVDLVIELPFLYSCNSAEFFAKGAVRLLSATGAVTHISFGSEIGELEPLMKAASILASEADDFREHLRAALKSGMSYPAARSAAVREISSAETAEVLKQPNNILAVEYLKQLIRLDSDIIPVTFAREGAGYFESEPKVGIAGAGALRKMMCSNGVHTAKDYVPAEAYGIYEASQEDFAEIDNFFTMIAYAARMKSADELSAIMSASEGLENRLKKALDNANGISGLISAAKSKRYTETRIKRFLFHTLFGVTGIEFDELDAHEPAYFRVLAMNAAGRRILKAMTDGGLDVITNLNRQFPVSDAPARFMEFDVLAADIYNLVAGKGFRSGSDYRARPFVL
ncbi:MAG: nucleotidyltransferase [Clostridiales Family XIII bacterium]|jgi:predicted nucleotidyltransferase|nr:nucleotidyltransferase [Clostridiales Family XIII bacterium]